jgi:cytochrome c2
MEIRTLAIIIGVLLTSASTAQEMGDPAAGQTVFRKCMSCHAVGEGARNKVGPELNGVVGRKAGGLEGYKYSPAMMKAGEEGMTWTSENLHAFLESPKTFLPGTKMAFPGLKEQADRDNVIAYLGTFSATGAPAAPAVPAQ